MVMLRRKHIPVLILALGLGLLLWLLPRAISYEQTAVLSAAWGNGMHQIGRGEDDTGDRPGPGVHAVDSNGAMLAVADVHNDRVVLVDVAGGAWRTVAVPAGRPVTGIALLDGNLYVLSGDGVYVFGPDGRPGGRMDLPGADGRQLLAEFARSDEGLLLTTLVLYDDRLERTHYVATAGDWQSVGSVTVSGDGSVSVAGAAGRSLALYRGGAVVEHRSDSPGVRLLTIGDDDRTHRVQVPSESVAVGVLGIDRRGNLALWCQLPGSKLVVASYRRVRGSFERPAAAAVVEVPGGGRVVGAPVMDRHGAVYVAVADPTAYRIVRIRPVLTRNR